MGGHYLDLYTNLFGKERGLCTLVKPFPGGFTKPYVYSGDHLFGFERDFPLMDRSKITLWFASRE